MKINLWILGICAASLLCLSGCGVSLVDSNPPSPEASADQGPAGTPPADPAPATPMADLPDYQVQPTSEPNQYEIVFSSAVEAHLASAKNDPDLTDIYQGGQTYHFLLKKDGQMNIVDIRVPKDLVFEKAQTADSYDDWTIETDGRIFLKRDAILTTLNRNLTMQASAIISEGAQIQTFPPNAKAARAQNGRSGGKIRLKAAQTLGHLGVALRGEAGGDGIQGNPGPSNKAGAGISYNFSVAFPQLCSRLWHLGGSGLAGLPGHPGGPGGRGGDTGDLVIEAADVSGLTLGLERSTGLGGVAGAGGAGQPGGDGGQSGTSVVPDGQSLLLKIPANMSGVCGPDYGPKGQDGATGAPGIPGNPGLPGSYCHPKDGKTVCE